MDEDDLVVHPARDHARMRNQVQFHRTRPHDVRSSPQ
jgi:hypothetical protein